MHTNAEHTPSHDQQMLALKCNMLVSTACMLFNAFCKNCISDKQCSQCQQLSCRYAAEFTHLCLSSSDRATHDEAMTPHSPVPFGPYPLDLNIFKACLGEPLHHIKLMFWSPQSCIHTTMVWPISESIDACVIAFSISLDRSNLKFAYLTMYRCAKPGDMFGWQRYCIRYSMHTFTQGCVGLHNIQSVLCQIRPA